MIRTPRRRSSPIHSQCSGVALMVVLFSLLFMSIIAYELIYASRVDLRISANARNRLQAWYMAQSSARLSLLRIHLYREARNLLNKNKSLKIPEQLVDQVWSFPLPSFPLPGQVFGEDHHLPGEMAGVIRSEGSLIPINLLDGNSHRNSSKEIAEQISSELKQLIESTQESDDEFNNAYSGLRPEDLIHPLIDWIDDNTDKIEGGDELGDYDNFNPPYEPRNGRMPVLSELRLVAGWNDDLYNRFASEMSVHKTTQTINPNYISLKRLKSFHPDFENEDLQKLEEKRREEPFANLEQMAQWITAELPSGRGFEFPLEFKSSLQETIFRIEASGIVGLARRVIQLTVRLDEKPERKPPSQNPTGQEGGSDTPPTTETEGEKSQDTKPKELRPPTVVGFEVIV